MKDRKNPNSNRQQGGAGSQGHWQQSQQSQQPSRNDKMRKGSDRKDSSSHRSQQR